VHSPQDIDDIFKVTGSKVKVGREHYKKFIFRRRHTDRRFAVEDHLVVLVLLSGRLTVENLIFYRCHLSLPEL